MKNNLVSIISIILLLLTVGFSGCNDTTETGSLDSTEDNGNDNIYMGTILSEEFSINEYRGSYMSPNSEILLSYDEQTLDQKTTLTVETVETFPQIDGAQFVVGYDFGPQGTQFNKAVNFQIVYNDNDVPVGVNEEDLRIYLYQNNELAEITDCTVSPEYNIISGKIYHFCQYMVCSYTPGGGTGSGGTGGSGSVTNNSAVIAFEVPVQLYDKSILSDDEEEVYYSAGAYIVWSPEPYVRYYELTIHFNGNEPEPYAWEKYYTQQGEDWGNDPWVPYVDNELLIIGDSDYYPGHGRYLGDYDNFGGTDHFEGNHGTIIGLFDENFYTDKCGGCYLDSISTPKQILDTEKAIKAFAEDYFRDWTVTVRPVT
ncbi:MAG TPA: hypothetical protein VKP59_03265 [Candidatus Thermoplasmatota archaeon]|nr:hypothetical protein [Candidatus Thermoplasmatota archaeon]